MIYDPARRALELRQRILELMTAEEIGEYAKRLTASDYFSNTVCRTLSNNTICSETPKATVSF